MTIVLTNPHQLWLQDLHKIKPVKNSNMGLGPCLRNYCQLMATGEGESFGVGPVVGRHTSKKGPRLVHKWIALIEFRGLKKFLKNMYFIKSFRAAPTCLSRLASCSNKS